MSKDGNSYAFDIHSHADSRGSVARPGGGREVIEHWSPLSEVMEPDRDPWIDEACERIGAQLNELMASVHQIVDPEERLMAITRQLKHLVDQQRRKTFLAVLRYFWHEAMNPWEALKRLLAVTRRVKADFIQGISQQEAALLLRETVRGTVSAREQRVYESLMIRWGMKGFLGTGGVKPASAREKYSKAQQGNSSRRKGERRKRRAARSQRSEANETNNEIT